MRTYLARQDDRQILESHRLLLCDRLRLRVTSANGDPALMEILAKESQAMSCDIPELEEWIYSPHLNY